MVGTRHDVYVVNFLRVTLRISLQVAILSQAAGTLAGLDCQAIPLAES